MKKILIMNTRLLKTNNQSLKTFFILLSVVCGLSSASAQNDPMFTHFMYHEHVFNPAVAGNARAITVGLLARQQWIGFKGAPSTQLLNAYGYIPKIKGGVGLVVANDMLGKERSLTLHLSYAYRQRIGDNAFLSGGLSLGILNRAVKGNELIYEETGDQSAINAQQNTVKPDVGLGLELTVSGFTVGGSLTHLDQSLKKATVFKVPRHYFGYAKYSWDISDKVTLLPAIFLRSSAFITQVDVSVNATFNKRVTVGAIYRSTDDAGMLLGVHFSKFFVSYSYDFDFGELKSNQSGSHELTLIGRFQNKKPKVQTYKSPRYLN
jgi:type IX secretion system PorP/SprF family membrane protein